MVGRRAVLTCVFLLAGASSGIAAFRAPASARVIACPAALVHYEWNRKAQGAAWITAGPNRTRLEGYLYRYKEYLGDGRVNRSDRVVLRAGREEKIAWFSRRWGGRRLQLTGRRLDGSGSFSQRFQATPGAGFYPSGIRIPTPGCWQLTLRTEGWARHVIVDAVEPAPAGTCDATRVDETGSVTVTPARAGIAAGWSWRTSDGGALLYAGGSTPEGGNTKVLWRASRPGGELVVRGDQLDGAGTFRQSFPEAESPRGFWPSIVTVPNPGCWLLTVRINGQQGAAGILVTRVVDVR